VQFSLPTRILEEKGIYHGVYLSGGDGDIMIVITGRIVYVSAEQAVYMC